MVGGEAGWGGSEDREREYLETHLFLPHVCYRQPGPVAGCGTRWYRAGGTGWEAVQGALWPGVGCVRGASWRREERVQRGKGEGKFGRCFWVAAKLPAEGGGGRRDLGQPWDAEDSMDKVRVSGQAGPALWKEYLAGERELEASV